ncbi:MAG: PfkB family carbohydrate kinase, partial [Actinomycetota bacterium]
TGAGDTVIGTLAACLAAGATMREAAVLANVAASVVVGEVGTVPITAEKLLRAAEMRNIERPSPSRASRDLCPPFGKIQGGDTGIAPPGSPRSRKNGRQGSAGGKSPCG